MSAVIHKQIHMINYIYFLLRESRRVLVSIFTGRPVPLKLTRMVEKFDVVERVPLYTKIQL